MCGDIAALTVPNIRHHFVKGKATLWVATEWYAVKLSSSHYPISIENSIWKMDFFIKDFPTVDELLGLVFKAFL